MSTFKTSLKIVAAHRIYVLVYLVVLSLFGLNVGAARTEDTSARFSRWRTPRRLVRTPPRRTASATSSSFRPDTGSGSRRPLAKAPSLPGWTRSSDTNRPRGR